MSLLSAEKTVLNRTVERIRSLISQKHKRYQTIEKVLSSGGSYAVQYMYIVHCTYTVQKWLILFIKNPSLLKKRGSFCTIEE